MSDLLLTDPAQTERWDKEWLQYLCTENPAAHLRSYEELGGSAIDRQRFAGLDRDAMLDFAPLPAVGGWFVWATGKDLLDRDVLEFGCGCGFFGKQVGRVARSYTGVDVSALALHIAKLVSPGNCRYLHVTGADALAPGSIDIVVGRHFFIHQPWPLAESILRQAHAALRPGGSVRADFWLSVKGRPEGTVIDAAKTRTGAPGADRPASAAYRYTEGEIGELAAAVGLRVDAVHDRPAVHRRYVELVKD